MILPAAEAERFFRIWWPLLSYVNSKRGIVHKLETRPRDGALKMRQAVQLRDALWADDSLRQDFITENPAGLSEADLVIVASWQHRVSGTFFVLRYLKRYTVFIETKTSCVFGVLGLCSPLEELLGPRPPRLTDTVLLPFEGYIVIDGLLTRHGITFGAGIRRMLEDSYRNAKANGRIVTSLPAPKSFGT
jgi:hypothetical protein